MVLLLTSFLFLFASAVSGRDSFEDSLNVQKSSGERDVPLNIINGTVTNIKQHPYQAAIYFNNRFFGSGAILDKQWIVSVGLPSISKEITIQVGETNINTTRKGIYLVEKAVIHPKFTLGTKYNVGLIKLQKRLKFSKSVKPISIASELPKKGTKLITTGWGSFDQKNVTVPSTKLRKADLFAVPREECAKAYVASIVSSTSICANNNEVDGPNIWDFGDPLVEKKTLVGINQGVIRSVFCYSHPCPHIYTDLTQMKNWIIDTIKKG